MKITIEQIVLYSILGFLITCFFQKNTEILAMFVDLLKILISGYIGYITKSIKD